VPAVRALLGQPDPGRDPTEAAILGRALPANDGRQDYVRATVDGVEAGLPRVSPLGRQDSSMLAALARADVLVVRPPHAPEAPAGAPCRVLRLGGTP
jgi:molybdopterin molybdotransferase